MTSEQLRDEILDQCYGGKAMADPVLAGGLLDIIKGLSDKGLGLLEIIEWGPKLIAMFKELAPHIAEVQARVRVIIEIVVNTFKPQPVPPVVKP